MHKHAYLQEQQTNCCPFCLILRTQMCLEHATQTARLCRSFIREWPFIIHIPAIRHRTHESSSFFHNNSLNLHMQNYDDV